MLYGQFNEILYEIKNKLSENHDLIKFLHYKDINVDVYDDVKFKVDDDIIASVMDNQIIPYRKIDFGENDIYIMIKLNLVSRKKQSRDGGMNKYFTGNCFSLYTYVSNALIDTSNGDRLCALISCIQDSFTDINIGSFCNCFVGDTVPENTVKDIVCLKTDIWMTDTNNAGMR